jgi:lysyl-tRNA synthetase class 1
MDSVRVNDWVSDVILDFPHPLHIKYEMFLDKIGKKISKSAGNVLTPQTWLKYGTPQSLLLLLLKRITGTRTIGIEDVPALMDEYDAIEDLFFGKKKETNYEKMIKIKGLYEYVNHLHPPIHNIEHVPYQLIAQQGSLFNQDRIEKIYERLIKYRLVTKLTPELKAKIECACNWADDYLGSDEKFDIALSVSEVRAINELKSRLQDINDRNASELAQDIQNAIYQSARANTIEPKKFFELLYKILINNTNGPKLGSYILDLGIKRTIEILDSYI